MAKHVMSVVIVIAAPSSASNLGVVLCPLARRVLITPRPLGTSLGDSCAPVSTLNHRGEAVLALYGACRPLPLLSAHLPPLGKALTNMALARPLVLPVPRGSLASSHKSGDMARMSDSPTTTPFTVNSAVGVASLTLNRAISSTSAKCVPSLTWDLKRSAVCR